MPSNLFSHLGYKKNPVKKEPIKTKREEDSPSKPSPSASVQPAAPVLLIKKVMSDKQVNVRKKGKACDADVAIRAIVRIQRWFRRHMARVEEKRNQTWKIFETLEYNNEQDQNKLHTFFNTMLEPMNLENNDNGLLRDLGIVKRRNQNLDMTNEEEDKVVIMYADYTKLKVENSYQGVHFVKPFTKSQLNAFINNLKSKQKKTLHPRYVLMLLLEIRTHLQKLNNINYCNTLSSKKFTVVGDLHGKLEDLLIIFHKCGLPAVGNPFLFNGDYVDRGANSLEVVLLLFLACLVSPDNVFFNRGNHEEIEMNIRYGFNAEIKKKYPDHYERITILLQEVWTWLPLATIIDSKIFVCHGGISTNVEIAYIEAINRHKYVSLIKGIKKKEKSEDDVKDNQLLLDLLWSDPDKDDGCFPNDARGGGCVFGPDITNMFLERNDFSMIIRSHQCKPEGFEFDHNNKLLTIFSASNYYAPGGNKGAIARFTNTDRKPDIVQFVYSSSLNDKRMSIAQRVDNIQHSAIVGLKDKIAGNRLQLINRFRKFDPQNTGFIRMRQFVMSMEQVLRIDIPWSSIADRMVVIKNNNVQYMSLFTDIKVECNVSINNSDQMQSFTEKMYSNKSSLEAIFHALDTDKSGLLSLNEFSRACSILSEHTGQNISKDDAANMAKAMDRNKDGQIDFNEFLEAFRIVGKDSAQNL